MTFIRTVLGDIQPEELGVCLPHEHLLGRPPAGQETADLTLDSESAALQELVWFRQAGGGALVEMSTPDYGRDSTALRRLSEASGVHIICASGLHKEKFSGPLLERMSVDELARQFTAEVGEGIAPAEVHAGVIKAASMEEAFSGNTRKLFVAAARAHRACGAPISTHTEGGKQALEQVALLRSEGVEPQHLIIGHVDRLLEWQAILPLAQTGVFMGFDQVGKEKYYPDSLRIATLLRLAAEGFGAQVLLSSDLARRSYLPAYGVGGGPGFTYIPWRFAPWLREAGMAETAVQNLLVHNPARALGFAAAG